MLVIEAAGRCVWRVASDASGALGIFFTLAGSIAEAWGAKFVMPSWGWIAIGAVLFFVSACRIEMELEQEKAKNRKPRPDMSLLEVLRRIRSKQDVIVDGETIEIVRAFTRIKELALTGEITVFGAPGIKYIPSGDVDAVLPRIPIPPQDWSEYSLSLLSLLENPNCGRVENDDSNERPSGSGYGYIWFDRKQIESIWPLRGRKLTWRNPLNFEKTA